MKKDVFTKVLEDHRELSSLPQAVAEIIKVARDPNASANDLARAIMKDPSLTARLLRVVNSPYYSPVQPVTTISQAVVTIGSRPITAMALAASIYNMVNNVDSTIDRKKFWRHSLEAALAAQAIARAVNYESPEEAFIAGLLHDIGILILDASFREDYARIWKLTETGEKLIEMEEEYWSTNHARVGQFLMRQWGLPEILCDAVGGHHLAFGDEDSHPHQKVILIVNLANRISKFRVGNVPPPETRIIELKRRIIANLNLSEEKLGDIERGLISEVVNESGYLEIDIGDLEEILSQANQLLYEQYMTVEKLLLQKIDLREDGETADDRLRTEIFDRYLNAIAGGIKRRSLVLKKALETGEIRDKKGYLQKTVITFNDWADKMALIIEQQDKARTESDYLKSADFQRVREMIERSVELTTVAENEPETA